MAKVIAYDLCNPGRDYTLLGRAIVGLGLRTRVTESCWVVSTHLTCVEVRDYLGKYIDPNDRLFVGDLTGASAWTRVLCLNDELKAVLT